MSGNDNAVQQKIWFHARGGEQSGPISASELKRLAINQTLRPDDLVWRSGMTEWVAASRIKGLMPVPPPPPQPARQPANAAPDVTATGLADTMIRCSHCGARIFRAAERCPHCGAPDRLPVSRPAPRPTVTAPFSFEADVPFRPAHGAATASPRYRGNEPVPPGIKGWSWGAFFFNWIWAICNNTWIGLLALIPYVGFFVAIVLGFKGREWAWKNGTWSSVERFNTVQRRWSVCAGFAVMFAFFMVMVAVVMSDMKK